MSLLCSPVQRSQGANANLLRSATWFATVRDVYAHSLEALSSSCCARDRWLHSLVRAARESKPQRDPSNVRSSGLVSRAE